MTYKHSNMIIYLVMFWLYLRENNIKIIEFSATAQKFISDITDVIFDSPLRQLDHESWIKYSAFKNNVFVFQSGVYWQTFSNY